MSKKIGQGIRQTFRKNSIKVNVTIDGTHVVNIKLVEGDQAAFDKIMADKFATINSEAEIAARAAGAPLKAEKPVREKKEKAVKEKKEKKSKGSKEPAKVSREQLGEELDTMEEGDLRDLTARALAGKAQNFPIGFVGKTYKEAAGSKPREEQIEICLDAFAAEEQAA